MEGWGGCNRIQSNETEPSSNLTKYHLQQGNASVSLFLCECDCLLAFYGVLSKNNINAKILFLKFDRLPHKAKLSQVG